MRRLPIYLLLDVSGSMRGEPIEAVNLGVKTLVETLRKDPYALETAFLSIITFNNESHQLMPLTEVFAFQQPQLTASMGTYLGKALRLLADTIDKEVVKTTTEMKGDWKPLVFIMSDGRSGDSITKAMSAIDKKKLGFVIACAAGRDSNIEALREITETVVKLESMDRETISSFFKWVSASVATSSAKVEESNGEVTVLNELPPLPDEITIA